MFVLCIVLTVAEVFNLSTPMRESCVLCENMQAFIISESASIYQDIVNVTVDEVIIV